MTKSVELLGGEVSDVLSRVQALERSKADPRVAEALTKLVLAPPFTAQSSRALWASVFEQLGGAQAHPGVLLALRPRRPWSSAAASSRRARRARRRRGAWSSSRLSSRW